MPRPRTVMRKIREALRLCLGQGLSPRQLEVSLGVPRITVRRYLERAQEADLQWPLPEGMDDHQLEQLLFPPPIPYGTPRPTPDWAEVHRELRRKGVTLQLLWVEYKQRHPDGQFSGRSSNISTSRASPGSAPLTDTGPPKGYRRSMSMFASTSGPQPGVTCSSDTSRVPKWTVSPGWTSTAGGFSRLHLWCTTCGGIVCSDIAYSYFPCTCQKWLR